MSVLGNNILAGASGQGGYFIDRSLRFRSSASAYLNRTPASAGNRKTWTWSGWVKFGRLTETYPRLFSTGVDGNNRTEILFITNTNQIRFLSNVTGTSRGLIDTVAYLRDPSAWYHLVVSLDASSTTLTMYINGVQQTLTTSTAIANVDHMVNATNTHSIGRYWGAGNHFDGYMTEINFVDGQALDASSFGEYNSDTGVWQPIKYVGTYGTNGFYLNFSDNSTTTTLGYDTSGNSNNWTANNISVTSGVTYDSMTDVPTLTSEDAANYPTLNPLFNTGAIGYLPLSNANLTAYEYSGSAAWRTRFSTIAMTSGKYYAEFAVSYSGVSSLSTAAAVGFGLYDGGSAIYVGQTATTYGYLANGLKYNNSASASYGATFANGDIIGVAYDADAGTLTFFKNGASQGVAYSGIPSGTYFFGVSAYWVSPDGTTTIYANFGATPFAYTPPAGFKSLNTYNLPDSTIEDGSEYFNAVLYTGNGSTQSITGVGFQPDLVWGKGRSFVASHRLWDSVRGATAGLTSNGTNAEFTESGLTSFDTDGFTVGSGANMNSNTNTFVAWNWKANGGGVSNTDGSITSTVSANTTAGFSIVTYTGNGTAGATVGHGLGVSPSMVFIKSRSSSNSWIVTGQSFSGKFLNLDGTQPAYTSSVYSSDYTSTTFSLKGTDAYTNYTSYNYVAYCFADVEGYSKFGSYTGNASADGPFVYTGFRPAFVMFKRTDSTSDWHLYDTSRSTYNVIAAGLYADLSNAENSGQPFDILSNGFKLRVAGGELNTSSATIIYMAFAENPFKNSLAR